MSEETISMIITTALMVAIITGIQLFIHRCGYIFRENIIYYNNPYDRELPNVLDRLSYIGYIPTLLMVLMYYCIHPDIYLALSFFVISFLCTHLHMYHILMGVLPYVSSPNNKPRRCPKCKSELIIDGMAHMQSLVPHVTDPNDDVPLSNKWVCPNKNCQLHSMVFWNSDGEYYLCTKDRSALISVYWLSRKIIMEAINSPARRWHKASKTIYGTLPFTPYVHIHFMVLKPVIMGDKVIDWNLQWTWHCYVK